MTYPYPRNTVWLIEARVNQDPDEPPAMGSGVVVSLRLRESKRTRRYILTCAHVIKLYNSTPAGFVATGRLRRKVLCWPPGRGFSKWEVRDNWPSAERDGVWTADVIDVLTRPDDDWSADDCSPEKDWVLLDVTEASFQKFSECRFETSEFFEEPLSIVGYPGGSTDLYTGRPVENKVSSRFVVDRTDDNPSIMRPEDGGPAGPGMSGGGVFDNRGHLVGLYRGQNVGHLSMTAIRSSSMASQLWRARYEVISTPGRGVAEGVRKLWTLAMDFGSINGWLAKAIVAAPLINLVENVGPLWPSRITVAFAIIIAFLLLMLASWALLNHSGLNRRWLKLVVGGSLALAVVFLAVYLFQAGRYIRFNSAEKKYVTIGTELTEVAELVFPNPATRNIDAMFENFGYASEIWLQSSIDQTERNLACWWLAFWLLLGSTGIGSLLLLASDKPVVES